ncbi:MAG: hypothetical protein DSY81_00200 [Bacillota bacterium]|nr:MAG: hypothetical protein DSY81_00200 [Bacillota bacterium]
MQTRLLVKGEDCMKQRDSIELIEQLPLSLGRGYGGTQQAGADQPSLRPGFKGHMRLKFDVRENQLAREVGKRW